MQKIYKKENDMEKVKILNNQYDLVEVEHIPGATSGTVLGEIDYITNTIKLKKGLPPERATHTIWHEIIHGILEAQGRHKENDNEELIDCLATGICCVLADNDFLKLIKKG